MMYLDNIWNDSIQKKYKKSQYFNNKIPYMHYNVIPKDYKKVTEIIKNKDKFCCFLISNGSQKVRNDFFNKLSNEYKHIDSGGPFMNNIGNIIPKDTTDTKNFIKRYKFMIVFENSSEDGYVTEKIVKPYVCGTIPIYWGSPSINKIFNNKAFINYHDYNDFNKLIERIKEVDNNDKLYLEYLRQPLILKDKIDSQETILKKLKEVIDTKI